MKSLKGRKKLPNFSEYSSNTYTRYVIYRGFRCYRCRWRQCWIFGCHNSSSSGCTGATNRKSTARRCRGQHGNQTAVSQFSYRNLDANQNQFFTAAAFRCCFDGLDDLLPYLYQPDGTKGLPQELIDKIEMAPYTKADFQAVIVPPAFDAHD